ncbi:MAG: NAD(P)H-hydrate dehydratase, partial [Bacteroidota bacterium]
FYYGRAKEFTGEVITADIGIPRKAITETNLALVELQEIRRSFPSRSINSHKHSVGKIFVLAGSNGMMGAAWLCSQSAMRSGAGQVILGVPESEYPVIAKRTVEVMPLGLPDTVDGSIARAAMKEIYKRIDWSTVVLLGCGMSQQQETQELIREVIRSTTKPMVVDADGLNALAGHNEILKNRKSHQIVITPHHGEFSKLTGIASTEIEQQKFSLASAFAQYYNVIVVLKGAPTIVAEPGGKIFVNSTGNPGMSTAGSGDVLAGMIASLMGQGNSALEAAVNAVFLHGRAGDIGAAKIGMHSLMAGDLIRYLPNAVREVLV